MTSPMMKLATRVLSVDIDATVGDAVARMAEDHRGAVVVTVGEKLVGVFTERDLVEKVARKGLDTATTPISTVMSNAPESVSEDAERSEALAIMMRGRFRHLPVCDAERRPVAMLSARDLLAHQLGRLRGEIDSLEAYLLADGPGGD